MKRLFTISFLPFFLLAGFSALSQSLDWRQMNSSITIFTQHPSDPNVLFAGDQAGLIKKSTNKGASWKIVSMQSEAQILDIKFLTNTTGFATVSQAGLILMTTDGGNSWRRKQFTDTINPKIPYNQILKRIVIADNQTVFFDLYKHPISNPSPNEVLVTRNGGTSFQIEKAPGNVYHVAGDTLIAFGKELSNFVNRFTIYKSTNKGLSWSVHKMSPTGVSTSNFNNNGIETAFFLSSKVFYVNANRNLASDPQIYKTTDGGLTFSIVPAPTTSTKYFAFYFKNEMEAVVTLANSWTYFTTTGGTSWTRAKRDIQSPLLALGNNEFLANLNGVTAFSPDFGNTWNLKSKPLYNGTLTATAANINLKVVNDSIAFATLGRRTMGEPLDFTLVKTTDGGMTWHETILDGVSPTGFPVYHAVSPDTLFSMGTGYGPPNQGGYLKIRYSEDGGKTYTEKFTGQYNEVILKLIFVDKMNGIAYSQDRPPIYTTDGGNTWTRSTPITNYGGQVIKMSFPTVNTWYVLATDAKVYKSIDKGTNWTNASGNMVLSSGGLECNSGVYFTTELTGFVYGCKGKLHKTTDGGNTWVDLKPTLPSTISNNNFTALEFQTPSIGYALDPGSNGQRVVMKTSDGGNTWAHYTGVQNYIGLLGMDFGKNLSGGMIANSGNYNKYVGNLVFNTDSVQIPKVITGILEGENARTSSHIYPNPASEIVTVSVSGNVEILSVKMFDATGQTVSVKKDRISAGKISLGTSSLQPGIYFIELETSKGFTKEKVIISR